MEWMICLDYAQLTSKEGRRGVNKYFDSSMTAMKVHLCTPGQLTQNLSPGQKGQPDPESQRGNGSNLCKEVKSSYCAAMEIKKSV